MQLLPYSNSVVLQAVRSLGETCKLHTHTLETSQPQEPRVMGMAGRHLPGRAAGCGGAGLPPQTVHRLRAAPVRARQEATAVPLLPQLHRGLRQLPLPGPTLMDPSDRLGDESNALHVGLCHLAVMA